MKNKPKNRNGVCIGLLLMLALILSLPGCAIIPLQGIDRSAVKTVGWSGNLDGNIYNVHTGITAFGNFSESISNDWKLPEFLAAHSKLAIEKAGYNFRNVTLTPEELVLFTSSQCFSSWDSSYKAEICGVPIANILRRYQIDVLIVSTQGSQSDPTNGPASLVGLGVFTRGTDRPNMLMPYASVWHEIYAGTPASPRKSSTCLRGQPRDPSPWSKAVAELEITDLAWLKPELEDLLARGFNNAIVAAGLSPSPPVSCPDTLPISNQY